MDFKFTSEEELFNRLKPAIKVKIDEAKKYHIDIAYKDIWKYFRKSWSLKKDLRLYEMVNDIIKLDLKEISNIQEENI